MRLLRSAGFFLLISSLLALTVFAQNSPSQNSQAPATQTPPAAQQPSQPVQPPSGDFLRNPFVQPNAGQSSTAPELKPFPRFKIKVLPQKIRRRQEPQPLPQGPIDPGIYLPRVAGLGHICGSIVSYNFSAGENPQLESITTCTPAGIVQSRRAQDQDEDKKPPALIRTKY